MAVEAQKRDLPYASSFFEDPKAGGLTVHPDDRLLVLLASHSPRNRNVGETQGACGGDTYAKGRLKPREGPLPKVPQKTGG